MKKIMLFLLTAVFLLSASFDIYYGVELVYHYNNTYNSFWRDLHVFVSQPAFYFSGIVLLLSFVKGRGFAIKPHVFYRYLFILSVFATLCYIAIVGNLFMGGGYGIFLDLLLFVQANPAIFALLGFLMSMGVYGYERSAKAE